MAETPGRQAHVARVHRARDQSAENPRRPAALARNGDGERNANEPCRDRGCGVVGHAGRCECTRLVRCIYIIRLLKYIRPRFALQRWSIRFAASTSAVPQPSYSHSYLSANKMNVAMFARVVIQSTDASSDPVTSHRALTLDGAAVASSSFRRSAVASAAADDSSRATNVTSMTLLVCRSTPRALIAARCV